jgi:hypothetical protein
MGARIATFGSRPHGHAEPVAADQDAEFSADEVRLKYFSTARGE